MSDKHRFSLRNLFGATLVVCVYLAAWHVVEPRARGILVGMVLFCLVTVGVLYLDDRRAKWAKPRELPPEPISEKPISD
jgi:hypothetical protein